MRTGEIPGTGHMERFARARRRPWHRRIRQLLDRGIVRENGTQVGPLISSLLFVDSLRRFCAFLWPFLAGYESDDALRSFITLLADTRPDCRVVAIGDHCDLGTLVAGRLHRRGELNVLFPTPVLIAVGVEDEHGWWRSGLQMMRGRRVDPEVAIVAPHALVAIRRDAPALDPVERADRNRTADVAWRQVVCREITRVR